MRLAIAFVAACGAASSPPAPPANTAPTPPPRTPPASVTDELELTDVAPPNGDADGGSYVVIHGKNFLRDGVRLAKIYFGQRQGEIVRFQSDTELIAQAPGGNPNDIVDVIVLFEPGGKRTLPHAFTFVHKDSNPTVDDLHP